MSETRGSVVVVGAGPVGATLAILLDQLGVDVRVLERRDGPITAPAAHVVNARTFEICRSAGVDMEALMARAAAPKDAGFVRWMTRIGGECIATLPFERQGDETLEITPTPLRNLAQHHFERVLHDELEAREIPVTYGTTWLSATDHGDRVTSQVEHIATGEAEVLTSDYLVGADGAGSPVRKWAGIEMEGPQTLGTFLMVHFEANFRPLVADEPGIIYWCLDPEVRGAGFIAHDIDREWVMQHPFDESSESVDDYTPERCMHLIVESFATDDVPPVEIKNISTWRMSAQVATTYRRGRVLLAGDAAHRFPPAGGMGLNTGVQDAHALVWRLAAVLAGWAPETVLDSYVSERRPVAKSNTEQSVLNAMKLVEVPQALGVLKERTTERMRATLDDPAGRASVVAAIEDQAEHFDMLGLQLGYTYESGAVVADGSEPPTLDNIVRHYVPTSRPGSRMPHAWVERDGTCVSTLDLLEPGCFTLLTAKPDPAWDEAMSRIEGVPTRVMSFGRDVVDPHGIAVKQLELVDYGAILVRPDQHVGWRTTRGVSGADEIPNAINTILGL